MFGTFKLTNVMEVSLSSVWIMAVDSLPAGASATGATLPEHPTAASRAIWHTIEDRFMV
jgi:hypothetical protein